MVPVSIRKIGLFAAGLLVSAAQARAADQAPSHGGFHVPTRAPGQTVKYYPNGGAGKAGVAAGSRAGAGARDNFRPKDETAAYGFGGESAIVGVRGYIDEAAADLKETPYMRGEGRTLREPPGGRSARRVSSDLHVTVQHIRQQDDTSAVVAVFRKIFDLAAITVKQTQGGPGLVTGHFQRIQDHITQDVKWAGAVSARHAPGFYQRAIAEIEQAKALNILSKELAQSAVEGVRNFAWAKAKTALPDLANNASESASALSGRDAEKAIGAAFKALDKWENIFGGPTALVQNIDDLKSYVRGIQETARRAADSASEKKSGEINAPIFFEDKGGVFVAVLPAHPVAVVPVNWLKTLALGLSAASYDTSRRDAPRFVSFYQTPFIWAKAVLGGLWQEIRYRLLILIGRGPALNLLSEKGFKVVSTSPRESLGDPPILVKDAPPSSRTRNAFAHLERIHSTYVAFRQMLAQPSLDIKQLNDRAIDMAQHYAQLTGDPSAQDALLQLGQLSRREELGFWVERIHRNVFDRLRGLQGKEKANIWIGGADSERAPLAALNLSPAVLKSLPLQALEQAYRQGAVSAEDSWVLGDRQLYGFIKRRGRAYSVFADFSPTLQGGTVRISRGGASEQVVDWDANLENQADLIDFLVRGLIGLSGKETDPNLGRSLRNRDSEMRKLLTLAANRPKAANELGEAIQAILPSSSQPTRIGTARRGRLRLNAYYLPLKSEVGVVELYFLQEIGAERLRYGRAELRRSDGKVIALGPKALAGLVFP